MPVGTETFSYHQHGMNNAANVVALALAMTAAQQATQATVATMAVVAQSMANTANQNGSQYQTGGVQPHPFTNLNGAPQVNQTPATAPQVTDPNANAQQAPNQQPVPQLNQTPSLAAGAQASFTPKASPMGG